MVKSFLEQLEFKEITINSYRYDLKDFNKFLLNREINFLKLNNEDKQCIVDKYLSYLKNEGYKPKSINRRCVSINRLMKYLECEVKAKSVRVQKKLFLNNILSTKEVHKILSKCWNQRDRAIIITLYGTGLRVSELLKMTVADVGKSSISIEGKYGKHREVLLSGMVRESLKEYLKVRPNTKERRLFIGKQGAITRQTVNNIINKYAKESRVSISKAYPHSFRHLFCKNLSEQGVSIDIISSLAGHESIETTMIYTKKTKNELENVLNRYFEI